MKSILTILALVISFHLFSQTNYEPGFIIQLSGDTLKGAIDYRNWESNPGAIRFKGDQNRETEFRPSEIKQFGVHDQIYVSGVVGIETSSDKTDELKEDPFVHIVYDTVFLETLFHGEKSLYFYKPSTNSGKDNFYISNGNGFELLIYKRYLTKISDYDISRPGARVITANARFVGQLSVYLGDCKSISWKLKSTSYSYNSLSTLFNYYFKCTSTDTEYQKKHDPIKTEFGVVGGVSFTSLNFTGDPKEHGYLTNGDYPSSTNAAGGLSLNIILPRNQGKFSVYTELFYTAYSTSSYYMEYHDEDKYKTTSTEIAYSYGKVNAMVRYKYPLKGSFLFVNAGASYGLAIKEKNEKVEFKKNYSQETTTISEAVPGAKKNESCLLGGFGWSKNRFSLQYRYEVGNGMSMLVLVASHTHRNYVLVGYRF